MLQFLLAAFAALQCALALHVTIQHNPPELRFTLPSVKDKNIGTVIFHYFIKNVQYEVPATQTSEGWEHITSDSILKGADVVKVFAVVNDIAGKPFLRTPFSDLIIDKTRTAVQPPSRRIRGAPYFRDDFNNFNRGSWKTEVSMFGGWNGEFQVYTNDPKNVYTQGGNLYLRPITTVSDPRFNENFLRTGTMDMTALFGLCTEAAVNGCTRHGRDGLLPPIMSGKVMSIPSMQYGILEVRARVPKGNWLWPGIWMLPTQSIYGSSPRSGEIDIMEYYDFLPRSVYTTLHWGPSGSQNGFMKTKGELDANEWHSGFHTWKMEWTPDHIVISVDNRQVVYVDPGSGGFWQYGGFSGGNIWQGHGKMAPFDQPFYLIFNVAVGGTSGAFPDGINYNGIRKPWSNNSPRAAEEFWNAHNEWLPSWQGDNVALQVDYVQFSHL